MECSTKATWTSSRYTLTLLLIMFIDGVGMSLVLPLIDELFSTGPHSIISSDTPTWLSYFYYGGSLACFSAAMVIGAAALGQLSDQKGRKYSLYLSLIGAIIGYLICAFAIYISSPLLFLSGRVIDGLTAGSVPVAQAMLADMDNQQNKITSIGKVMFALTSGYMFGPVIASLAFSSEQHFLSLPFLLVALLCLACTFFLGLIPESSYRVQKKIRLDLTIALKQIKTLLVMPNIRMSLLSFFLFQCAWTLFYQCLPKLVFPGIDLSGSNTSLVMAEVGVGMCVAFCLIVPKVQALPAKRVALYCFSLFTLVSAALLSFPINFFSFQTLSTIMAISYAIGYSAMMAFLVSIADDHQRGLIFGSIASICAISATVTALLGAAITSINYKLLILVLVITSLVTLILFSKISRQKIIKNDKISTATLSE